METTFDALNPGVFADFTQMKIKLIKQRYTRIAILAGVTGLIVGGIVVYHVLND